MNLLEIRDTVERLHWRIQLLMADKVWADQLIEALYRVAMQTQDSLIDVLEVSTTVLATIEMNKWTSSTPQTQLVFSLSRKSGTRLSKEIAALFR